MSKKIIIAGAGRSGTSFLMKLLTELDFDTGFDKNEGLDHTRAGYELFAEFEGDIAGAKRLFKSFPRILKAPNFSFSLSMFLERGIIDVGCIVLPVREIKEATKSRVDAGLHWIGVDKENFEAQLAEGLRAIGATVNTAMYYRIPFVTMRFPDIVNDKKYCYSKLKEVFDLEMPNRKKFSTAFEKVSRKGMIQTKVQRKVYSDTEYIKFD